MQAQRNFCTIMFHLLIPYTFFVRLRRTSGGGVSGYSAAGAVPADSSILANRAAVSRQQDLPMAFLKYFRAYCPEEKWLIGAGQDMAGPYAKRLCRSLP